MLSVFGLDDIRYHTFHLFYSSIISFLSSKQDIGMTIAKMMAVFNDLFK